MKSYSKLQKSNELISIVGYHTCSNFGLMKTSIEDNNRPDLKKAILTLIVSLYRLLLYLTTN